MNRKTATRTFVCIALALLLQACTTTVVRTRTVPVYRTHSELVEVKGSDQPRRIRRKVQVGTRTERYETKKVSWKKTAVGAAMAPVIIVSFVVASLG